MTGELPTDPKVEAEQLPPIDQLVQVAKEFGLVETSEMTSIKRQILELEEGDMEGFQILLDQYQMLAEQIIAMAERDEVVGSRLQQALAILSIDIYRQRPEQVVRDYAAETLDIVIDAVEPNMIKLGIDERIIDVLKQAQLLFVGLSGAELGK